MHWKIFVKCNWLRCTSILTTSETEKKTFEFSEWSHKCFLLVLWNILSLNRFSELIPKVSQEWQPRLQELLEVLHLLNNRPIDFFSIEMHEGRSESVQDLFHWRTRILFEGSGQIRWTWNHNPIEFWRLDVFDTVELFTEDIQSVLPLFGLLLLPIELSLLDRAPKLLLRELGNVEAWIVLNEHLSQIEEVLQFSLDKLSLLLSGQLESSHFSEQLRLSRIYLVDMNVLDLLHNLTVRFCLKQSRFCVKLHLRKPLLFVLWVPSLLRTLRSKLILRTDLWLPLGEENRFCEFDRLIFSVKEVLRHMALFVERVDQIIVSKTIKVHATRSISLCLCLSPSLFLLKLL